MAKEREQIGYCHLCGTHGKLTLEHIPPQSAGNDKWTCCHTLYGMTIGAEHKKMPPLKDCRRGMGRHSLCEKCNGMTAHYYNEAFANWTLQALELASKVDGDKYVCSTFHEIKPLSILKQIATMAIATADFMNTPSVRSLRRFVLVPFEQYMPKEFQIRIYLNPPLRLDRRDKMLTPNRMTTSATTMDITDGSVTACMAEVAFPPMGYLTLWDNPEFKITGTTLELTNVSHFGLYRWGQKADVRLSLPVRKPFGPVPGHYP